MKLKLDENVDARLAVLLRQAGHETTTVRDQRLLGMADSALYDHCVSEGHILVTLDLHFSNVLRFPPERTPVQTLANALTTGTPSGHLWIVEPGRLRVHEPTFEADS